MLRIYPVIVEMLRGLAPVMREIERRDADLARQMRRASASVALNVGEGMGSFDGNKRLRYRSALGSMRETATCVDVAVAMGYLGEIDGDLAKRMHAVTGTLVRLAT